MKPPLGDTLVICDMDNTLLTAKEGIPACNRAVIQLYTSMGGLFTVATGRPPESIRAALGNIRLSLPAISCNGALALVPCLAASRDGVRLGRGGGYYDRFLAHYKGAGLLLCPEALLLDELPCDDWDARFAPENILTEKGILQ